MKHNKWILLPVEVHNREFLSRLLLACCAVEKGFSIIIGKKNALYRSYSFLPRGMILDKAISGFRFQQLDKLISIGYKLSASDEESLGIYREPEIFLKQRLDENTLGLVDHFFTWGNEQALIINKRYPDKANKLKVTGSHRLDLTRSEFHSLYADEVNRIRQKYGRYILFPSNFSEIINPNGGREHQLWQRKKQGALNTDASLNFYTGFLEHLEKSLEIYKKIIPEIKKRFPDYKLVIRPHPGEDHGFWKEITKEIHGITVVHEGNIVPWLLGSEVMFHHSCSTGLEAFLLGVPSIAFHPHYNPDFDSHLSTRVGPIVKDKNKLIEFIQLAIDNKPLPRENTEWLNKYLEINNSSLASDRIIEILSNSDWDLQPLFTSKNKIQYLVYKTKRYFYLQARSIKRKLLSNTTTHTTTGSRKWLNMSASDIQHEIEKLSAATGRFNDFQVRKLTGQVFCIQKEE
jgi:surface carbohydrate biosynthesis protein